MKSRGWFTRSQRIFLLVVLNAVLVVAGALLLARYRNSGGYGVDASLSRMSRSADSVSSARTYAVQVTAPESFPFDPNEADSTQLLRLGLAPFQVRSIYRYRAKGGRFSTVDDFRRVYRLTNEQWDRLSPLIRIGRKYRLVDVPADVSRRPSLPSGPSSRYEDAADRPSSPVDSLAAVTPVPSSHVATGTAPSATYPRKLTGDATVDINLADSALLCRIPGIGPYFSRKLINYRRRLGGFVAVEQLLEIENFPADALAWMEVSDTTVLVRLDVNHISTRQLAKHPYMGYYRASEITGYRSAHGSVPDISVLRTMKHFSEEDIRRLQPYLLFR